MRALYVASDQPGAGKTALCVALADELRQRGKQANVYKPLAATRDGGSDAGAGGSQRPLGNRRANSAHTPSEPCRSPARRSPTHAG